MRWMAVAVMVGVSGLAGGCGGDGDDAGSGAPAEARDTPGTPAAGDNDPGGDGGGQDGGGQAAGEDGDGGDAAGGSRSFSGVCPTAEDIGARLGVEVTFQPELILDLDPTPEVECRYEWDDHNYDKGSLEASRQRAPEADLAFDGWAETDVDGETVVGVEPVALGDEGVVVSYGSYDVAGSGVFSHGADVVARVGDGLCHTKVDAASREPERSPTLEDTARYITATLCA